MEKRWITEKEGIAYTGMKRTKFRNWAVSIGAVAKIDSGRRGIVRYDLERIDAALEAKRRETHGEGA